MNNDPISRQTAIYNLAGIAKNCARSDQQKALMGRCIYMIENMPSVQPEQKTGKWIFIAGSVICSECKFQVNDPFYLGKGLSCPNCSAMMDCGLREYYGEDY